MLDFEKPQRMSREFNKQAEIDRVRNQIDELERVIKKLEGQIAALKAENAALIKERDGLKAENKTLSDTIFQALNPVKDVGEPHEN